MSRPPQRWVCVARILKSRGNKGEVAAELLTDFPERLTKIREVFLAKGLADGEASSEPAPRPAKLLSCWLSRNHPGQAVFHFEGYESISDAEKLRGLEVYLPFEQRVSLPAGQYFVTDLIGCAVFAAAAAAPVVASSPCSMAEAPRFLGTVQDVFFPGQDQPGTPLLKVETPAGELLIPLAEDICTRIDVAARRLEANLPDGLGELSESPGASRASSSRQS